MSKRVVLADNSVSVEDFIDAIDEGHDEEIVKTWLGSRAARHKRRQVRELKRARSKWYRS